MRALKIAVLLVLVVAAMRATSWILQWLLSRLARIPGRLVIVSGNLAAFPSSRGFSGGIARPASRWISLPFSSG